MSSVNPYNGKIFSQRYYDLQKVRSTLPVMQQKEIIKNAIRQNPVILLEGETGSGMTTQVPQFAFELMKEFGLNGKVLVTQPRKLAAKDYATRAAEELDVTLSQLVGYSTRDDKLMSKATRILFSTEGIPLAQLAGDPRLDQYNIIILDEAHERSSMMDTLLGVLKGILPLRSAANDLRIVVMSATIDAERFSRYFSHCPHIKVPGRTFNVKIFHTKRPIHGELEDEVAHRVASIHKNQRLIDSHKEEALRIEQMGDILVFVAGSKEISKIKKMIESTIRSENWENEVEVLALKACLPQEKQAYILDRPPYFPRTNPEVRRIIISTNVAETSVTLPRIKFVVDTGLVKFDLFNPATMTSSLINTPISQSQATQRAGRAGRLADGICFRLYSRRAFIKEMPQNTPPAICRMEIDGLILMFLSRNLGDIHRFDWLNRPSSEAILAGYKALFDLGAVTATGKLTPGGERMSRLPLEPRYSAVVLEAEKLGCTKDVLAIIAILIGRDLPVKTVAKEAADQAKSQWQKLAHHRGDHLTMRNLLYSYINESVVLRKEWCQKHYLVFSALESAVRQYRQLIDDVRRAGIILSQGPYDTEKEKDETDKNIIRAFLTGSFRQTAKYGLLKNPEAKEQYYNWTPIGPMPLKIELLSFLPHLSTYVMYDQSLITSKSHTMRCVTAIDENELFNVAPTLKYFNMKYVKEYEGEDDTLIKAELEERDALRNMIGKRQ